jgi:aminoglycoside phosphotransferase (APT) family kinase protein
VEAAQSKARAQRTDDSGLRPTGGSLGCHGGHGWLAAVLPANATRFRVSDNELGATLRDAGGELVDHHPDVEIGPSTFLRGDAGLGVVRLGRSDLAGRSSFGRALKRTSQSLSVRVHAAGAGRALRALGYESTEIIMFDLGQTFGLPEIRDRRHRGSFVERGLLDHLPQRALVVGRRSRSEPTLLETAVGEALGGGGDDSVWLSMREGLLIRSDSEGILRVAVGPARNQLDAQRAALAALEAAPPSIRKRVPQLLARGRSGLADWSLEERMAGARPPAPLSGRLVAECLDFLVDLHAFGAAAPGDPSATGMARLAERVCEPARREAVREIGRRVDASLADVRRGFAHGDFFRGNLLAAGGGLSGVVDWDAGGPGRFPLIDLIHFKLYSQRLGSEDWGHAIVRDVLPWARAGGDEAVRGYCGRIGLELGSRLPMFVAAHWLDHVAYQLRTYADRPTRRRWVKRNVTDVVDALLAYTDVPLK